ncbi:MAG: hypothetical protein R3Y54_11510 [Eubacteriales bacterium]
MITRENMVTKCEETLNTIENLQKDSSSNLIIQCMIPSIAKRTKEIYEICKVEKYVLSFMGSVGVGKSTAIANLIGLIDESVLEDYTQKEYTTQELPLLKTGAGRTTVCETRITLSDQNKCTITITPLSWYEVDNLINDFCVLENKDTKMQSREFSTEKRRVLINMAKIPAKISDKQVQMDYIKQTFGDSEGVHTLKEAITKNINYAQRQTVEFSFDMEQGKEEFTKWLRKRMKEINNGENDSVPFPSTIELNLSRNSLSKEIPEFIGAIEDTRGMDSIAAREDFNKNCEDIHKICIICDEIPSYGGIIMTQCFEPHFQSQKTDLKHRCIVLGLEKGAELKQCNSASNREDGKGVKIQEALDHWNSPIFLGKENVTFYNSYLGIRYDSEENCIIGYDEKKYNLEKESVFRHIEQLRSNMYESYYGELQELNQQLMVFANNQVNGTIPTEQVEKLGQLRSKMEVLLDKVEVTYEKCLKALEIDIRHKVHASCLGASVRRYGKYDNYNIYLQIANFGLVVFDDSCREYLLTIWKDLEELFEDKKEIEMALKIAIRLRSTQLYDDFRRKDSKDLSAITEEQLKDEQMWKQMMTYWGEGSSTRSYRDRIADDLLKEESNQKIIQGIVKQRNVLLLFEELVGFLTFE